MHLNWQASEATESVTDLVTSFFSGGYFALRHRLLKCASSSQVTTDDGLKLLSIWCQDRPGLLDIDRGTEMRWSVALSWFTKTMNQLSSLVLGLILSCSSILWVIWGTLSSLKFHWSWTVAYIQLGDLTPAVGKNGSSLGWKICRTHVHQLWSKCDEITTCNIVFVYTELGLCFSAKWSRLIDLISGKDTISAQNFRHEKAKKRLTGWYTRCQESYFDFDANEHGAFLSCLPADF